MIGLDVCTRNASIDNLGVPRTVGVGGTVEMCA